jgi:phosphoserine phosphatase
MNVYDFDGTIYDGDSSVDFWLYCSRRKPSVFLKRLPRLIKDGTLFAFRRIPKEKWKETFFSFLNDVPADEAIVNRFWETHDGRIKRWYLEQKEESDVIISASPVFLLAPISRKLGVKLIASEVNPKTGLFSGRNCSETEKVRRFRQEYPDGKVDQFFTDSKKDLPMAGLAERAYFVRGDTIREMTAEEKNKTQIQ